MIQSIACDLSILGDLLWTRFNKGYADQKWCYHGLLTALKPIAKHGFDVMYKELEALVQQVFFA